MRSPGVLYYVDGVLKCIFLFHFMPFRSAPCLSFLFAFKFTCTHLYFLMTIDLIICS